MNDVNDAHPRSRFLGFDIADHRGARSPRHSLESDIQRRDVINGQGIAGRFAALVRAAMTVFLRHQFGRCCARILVLRAGAVLFVHAREVYLHPCGAGIAVVTLVVLLRALLIHDINEADPRGHFLHFNVVNCHGARLPGHALESDI